MQEETYYRVERRGRFSQGIYVRARSKAEARRKVAAGDFPLGEVDDMRFEPSGGSSWLVQEWPDAASGETP